MMHDEGALEDEYQEVQDYSSPPPFCGFGSCFGLFSRNNCEHKYLVLQLGGGQHVEETTWWRKNLNKAKECAEVLGGTKWKKFIRKVGGYCINTKEKHKKRFSKKQMQKNTRFQYDIQSYALNFDSGNGREGDDAAPDFAARFSPPLSKEQGSIGRPVQQTDVQLP